MINFFTKRLGQNEQLFKNIEEYEQKKKAEQQKSEIYGQKPVNRKANIKENIDERGQRRQSIRSMV